MNALPARKEFAVVDAPTTQWLVLQCANNATVRLAESLNEAGIEAWTPVDDGVAMTASYVFARSAHLSVLLELFHSPMQTFQVWDAEQRKMVTKGHPYFRVMRSLDAGRAWATVRDCHLAPLRNIEHRRKPRGLVKAIPVGAQVRLNDGGFAGLDGIVQSVRSKFAMVSFVGFPVPVKIGCWLLSEKVD